MGFDVPSLKEHDWSGDLLQLHHEELGAEVHRAYHLELGARVEQHLRLGKGRHGVSAATDAWACTTSTSNASAMCYICKWFRIV